MIITVTMNPAIDKPVALETFQRGELNRLTKGEIDAGGKGINVSKTIRELGGTTLAAGFLGGSGGAVIAGVLKKLSIPERFLFVDGETLTNMKVVEPGGILTELNEPGPVIAEEQVEELLNGLVELADADTWFVLAGSIPSGVEKNIYGRIIRAVKAKGAKVFLDADGELFRQAVEAGPDLIKPNKFELEQYFGVSDADESELVHMGRELLKKGVQMTAISLGKEGAMFVAKEHAYRVPGLSVKARSAVGAGDAMVAALTYGMEQGYDLESCIRLGVAASAGAVITEGTKPPAREVVDQLMPMVEIQKII